VLGAAAGSADLLAGRGRRHADPAARPRAAVEAFLGAEQAGDHLASYRLLSGPARRELSPAAWGRQRSELPAVTGFEVERVEGSVVVAVVRHEPGLDPFIGLSPAAERQRWQARREGGGWLLEATPAVEPLLPPDDTAPAAALAWAGALQGCDAEKARGHQAVAVLYGTSDVPATLCRRDAALAVGPPERLAGGPSSQELVAQYGTEALEWARAVAVLGGERPFHVVLAPIGSVWQVVGVFEP
ncbi:MAG: hypothetical protein M3Q48_06115, partial [Actinomycetota bacterium]|nr:hypothetical protein [Actinomycetota bacterium]